MIAEAFDFVGWGTRIRTLTSGVRVRCSKLSLMISEKQEPSNSSADLISLTSFAISER